jgi:hypothetical protein
LLRGGSRDTKQHHRQNGNDTLADEHKLTSNDNVIGRTGRSNGCPIHGVVSSRHEWAIARSAIRLSLIRATDKAHFNFQSTIAPLTPKIKWKPDTNSPAQAGLHHLTHQFNHRSPDPKSLLRRLCATNPGRGEVQ